MYMRRGTGSPPESSKSAVPQRESAASASDGAIGESGSDEEDAAEPGEPARAAARAASGGEPRSEACAAEAAAGTNIASSLKRLERILDVPWARGGAVYLGRVPPRLNECRNGRWLLERCGRAARRVRRGGPSAGARRGSVLLSPSLKELRAKSIEPRLGEDHGGRLRGAAGGCGARWAYRVPAAALWDSEAGGGGARRAMGWVGGWQGMGAAECVGEDEGEGRFARVWRGYNTGAPKGAARAARPRPAAVRGLAR
jgi:hypothetical protein